MPRCVVKLTDPRDGADHYLLWSTIVDAPVGTFDDRGEALADLRAEPDFEPDQLRNLDRTGVPYGWAESAAELIAMNRAGSDESELTLEQIIDKYRRHPKEATP